MSGLFTGLSDLTGKGRKGLNATHYAAESLTVLPGQVLDICMDTTSILFETTSDIGKIRFRPLGPGFSKARLYEDEVGAVAYPLDRSVARYPLPGEMVMIYFAAGDQVELDQDPDGRPMGVAYYSLVVAANRNVTSNTNPAFGTPASRVSAAQPVTEIEAQSRFDKKIVDLDAYRDDDNQTKVFKQLQPFEGDFILQGRFGNTVRLGSTSPTEGSPWSRGGGASGDPIMILRCDRAVTTEEQDMLTVEDANNDDSSIYLSSSQTVAVSLSCTVGMKAWRHTLGFQPSDQASNPISSLQGPLNFT